ncbi:MAG: caspase family protein [Marinilabiliales bacterium]|nr:MAG: caspase family protein [Marinilabiliales bacterium]
MQMSPILNSLKTILISVLALNLAVASGQAEKPVRVSEWNNVTGFDISSTEDYMVVAMRLNNRGQLFESRFDGSAWSYPTPLNAINSFGDGNSDIGGPFLYFDESILYYHANFPGGEGGYDIYYSVRENNSWSEPVPMCTRVNSPLDELHPAMPPGMLTFYFSRSNPDADIRKPPRTPDCEIFYSLTKNELGEWGEPEPLHDIINQDCQYGLYIAPDTRSIYFSSVDQDNHRDGYNIYYVRQILGAWTIPMLIENIGSEATNIYPRIAGNNIYFLIRTETRRDITGTIYRSGLPEQFSPLKTIAATGRIEHLESKQPLNTPLVVYDPITLNRLGEFFSSSQTGMYHLKLLDEANYIIDIRNPGFSFASFQIDYRQEEKITGPPLIELFNEVELDISVYDSEIFRPLDADVHALNLNENKMIEAIAHEPGSFTLRLPVGNNYRINAATGGFESDSFDFDLFGDIIFSRFERDIALEPRKRMFEVAITDNETSLPVNAQVTFKNLNREEVISVNTFSQPVPDDAAGAVAQASPRQDDISFIPFRNPSNPLRFALIIGNEDYSSYQVGLQREANVDYAIRDAELFRKYAINVFGVPEENILFLTNARSIEMQLEIRKLAGIINALDGNAEVFFYYAGHGLPDHNTRDPYIIPVDVTGSNLDFAVKLSDLYGQLTKYPANRVTVFLDACFSGGARNVGLVSARAVRVRPREDMLSGNLVVFSASSEAQIAHPFREKQHGIFTYFALNKIKETKGNITYREFSDYLRQTVAIRSIMVNNAEQTPQTNVSPTIEEAWHEWIFN